MSQQSEIKSLIRSIANPSASGTSIFEAKVISASETSCTINYQGIHHSDVRLVAGMSGSTATIVAKPAAGSTVLVADLSEGKFRDMVVILTETTDSIVINGGQNGGFIKITPKMRRFFWHMYYTCTKEIKRGKKGQVLKSSKVHSEDAEFWKAMALLATRNKAHISKYPVAVSLETATRYPEKLSKLQTPL